MISSTIGEPYEIEVFTEFPQNPESRLFIPSNSDDLSHDEALSSRIAALNLLDLSLENLGVEIDASATDELTDVIKACGDSALPKNFVVGKQFIAAQFSPSSTLPIPENRLRSLLSW